MQSQTRKPIAKAIDRYAGFAFALDLLVIAFSALFATFLRSRFDSSFIDSAQALTLRLTGYSVIWLGGLYLSSAWTRSNLLPSRDSLKSITSASWRVAILIFATLYLIKMPISRIWVGTMLLTTSISLSVGRLIYQELLVRKFGGNVSKNVLIVSQQKDFNANKSELEKVSGGYFYKFVRIPPPSHGNSEKWLEKARKLINKKDIEILLIDSDAKIDSVSIISLCDENRHRIQEVYVVSNITPIFGRMVQGESTRLLRIQDPKILDSGRFIKRLLDISIGATIFLLALPLMFFAALGIKLTSKGPTIFIDERVGQGGKPFLFPKFRTMYADSSENRLQVLGRPDSKMLDRYKSDPRITPFGKFLRRWSIDEVPQLWCVLIGTMSLVGPRPILPQELPQVLTSHQARFIAKPGLTGLWQVSGRKLTSWEDRMAGDIAYIQKWSLANDFSLIVRTVGAILTGRGSF